ncbi:GNAT family N-acetyltransferase [Macrococcoides caseolyticum]|uniref:N-acetyltransferase n=1 Tax=Macrococcoides caseolyticum TaxID=69966 RepID=A0A855GM47_9STAP|nr:GNAT family N-acetyltransferase [Macrococcus caseolyticus]ARQ03439.1 Protease synthase and sporulation negative regulatory protein PAI 1 [Macrococcus caseolyticus]PKE22326.1 N-acetyltransferase [Macrococcus caseolyticus]PKE27009.1 N-acetyltransferase [Macrococcus caseolyticus]PKE33753.1 N-acetyltransferase [Macrococcus caseolyticus]PKE35645.1 N-acetyltransferase [Macrococcus caseolyticus]
MNSKIRNMTEKDIPKIQNIAKLSWHDTYEEIIPLHIQDNFLEMAYSISMLEKRLALTNMYVAEFDDQVVGFANFSKDENGIVELTAIYLLSDYRNLRIGSALIKHGISRMEGIKFIDVVVEKENKVGYNFYKKFGFVVQDEFEDDFDGHILQSVRMRLTL